MVLLNRQRMEKYTASALVSTAKGTKLSSPSQAVNGVASSTFLRETHLANVVPRGRTLVLDSSEALISAFMFLYHRVPAALIDWTIAQQAFNCCMVLLLDAIKCRAITTGVFKAEQAFVVFKDLYENRVHTLAGMAVEKISFCLQELHLLVTQPSGVQARGRKHAILKGAGHNEVARAFGATDEVMGQTGMFLLEDLGQQTFGKEDFLPMAWGDPELSARHEQQNHAPLHRLGMYGRVAARFKAQDEDTRSIDAMQGLRRSTTLRSASTRYASLSENDHIQPHGYTAPTSPAEFSMLHDHQLKSMIDHRRWQTPVGEKGASALHLPTELQKIATPEDSQDDMIWHHGWGRDSSAEREERRIRPFTWCDPREGSAGAHRQDTCPAVPSLNAHSPFLRPDLSPPKYMDRPITVGRSRDTPFQAITTAENTPFRTSQYFSHVAESRGYTSSAPHCAAPLPISSITETGPIYSPTIQEGVHRKLGQTRPQIVTHLLDFNTASTLTPMTENMNMNDWNA
jgi:hypothetical protein